MSGQSGILSNPPLLKEILASYLSLDVLMICNIAISKVFWFDKLVHPVVYRTLAY